MLGKEITPITCHRLNCRDETIPAIADRAKNIRNAAKKKMPPPSTAVLEKQWTEAEKIAAKKAEDEKAASPEQSNAPTKPTHQPHVSDHRRNTMTVPKFNMPRKTGGGGA